MGVSGMRRLRVLLLLLLLLLLKEDEEAGDGKDVEAVGDASETVDDGEERNVHSGDSFRDFIFVSVS
jgi:hypothetical protein